MAKPPASSSARQRLPVRRVGPGRYRVGEHDVDLHASDAAGRCTCADYVFRKESKGLDCRHIRAARHLHGTSTPFAIITL